MENGNGVEFVVDQQYENEKGVFTVVSIHRNEMVIKWESGEQMRTNIELQHNIQARRSWEKMEKEKAALALKSGRASGSKKAATIFERFQNSDFKNNASGTKWRGRNQLGGAVTVHLSSHRYHFNSWAFANKPEMHWLDIDHRKKQSGENCAKFFVRINPKTLFYGFNVGQPKDDSESVHHWEAFIEWLGFDDNEKMVHSVALNHDLIILDKNNPEFPLLVPIEQGWQIGRDAQNTTDSIKDFLASLPIDRQVNLEITKLINKEDSLSRGKEIAIDISELFSQLLPLYTGAWT